MSTSTESDSDIPVKKRRGHTNEDNYQRNIIRNARVKGIAYKSYGNKVVSERIQETYSCRCAQKCYSNVTEATRNDIWTYFYYLESKNVQDTYLQSLIEKRECKRRRKLSKQPETEQTENEEAQAGPSRMTTVSQQKVKNHFFTYNIKVNGKIQEVCKNTFIKLHGITANRVRRLCNLLVAMKSPKDQRGISRSGNAIPGEICAMIHNQISRFEVRETHYGGRQKQYLDARLNVKTMHEMFLKDHPEYENKIKYSFYRKFFQENFDYGFGRPQVDICSKCESFKVKLLDPSLSDNAKRNVTADMIIHRRRAKKFYTTLKAASDIKEDDTVALVFDYMQNQPLPLIPVQEVFYLRQLWVNIFCIHNLSTNTAKFYVYHEGQAHKSPNEVCTFLLNYFENDLPPAAKKLLLFSDGAAGQNKNNTVVRFLLSLCDNGRFESIKHFFPVRGHSFLPCDRDFGTIKRVLRRVDRIYTPDQYCELIKRASSKGRFTIEEVVTDDILAFKDWWLPFYKKTTTSDESSGRGIPKDKRVSFKISSYKEFLYSNQKKGKVVTNEFINGLSVNTFSFAKTTSAPALPSLKAYPQGKVPINRKKIEDLKKLEIYTHGYEWFYRQILSWPSCNNQLEALPSDVEED